MGRVSAELGRRIYLDTNTVIYVVEAFTQCDSFLTNDDVFKSLNLTQIRMLSDIDLT